jgi:hypothetical protein
LLDTKRHWTTTFIPREKLERGLDSLSDRSKLTPSFVCNSNFHGIRAFNHQTSAATQKDEAAGRAPKERTVVRASARRREKCGRASQKSPAALERLRERGKNGSTEHSLAERKN